MNFEEFLKLFFENLKKVKKEDRTRAKFLKALEEMRSYEDGLSDDEEKMYARAIKIGILRGDIEV